MKEANDATSQDEQTRNNDGEFDPEKFEDIGCPECSGEWYYEPKLRYGTRYEATSGWACQECSWTKVDPSSGKPASAPTPTPEDVEAYADRYLGAIPPCPDCGGDEVELGRVAVTDDNGEYVTNADGSVEVEPVIECADCRLTLRENPSPDIVGYLGAGV